MTTETIATLPVEILTPKGIEMTADCVFVKVPSVKGEMGILPSHSPAVVQLDMGELTLEQPDSEFSHYYIVRGYLHVMLDKLVLLTPFLEHISEIDLPRAKAAKDRAEKLLAKDDVDTVDRDRAQLALRRAKQRIHLCEYYRKG